jgi:hypothetical protein
MTILNSGTRNQYVATSGQTVFNYNFEITVAADIVVYQGDTLLALTTNYTLTGLGVDTGGTVTLVTGATTGDIITVYRFTAAERLTDYQNSGDFLSDEVNSDFDRLWAVIQENTTSSDFFLQLKQTTALSLPFELDEPVASNILRYKSDLSGIESAPLSAIPDADDASDLSYSNAGSTLSATNTEAAIDELDAEKANLSGAAFTGPISTITTNTALSDAAATLTAAQLIGGEFTITPTVARIQTTDTAANIIAAMTDSVNNSSFNTTMINLAAFDVTIAPGVGVTLVNSMVVNGGSGTFRVRRTSPSTVSITRLEAGGVSAPLTKYHKTTALTITAGGLVASAHGFGVIPNFVTCHIKCLTADGGFSVGDVLLPNLNSTTTGSNNFTSIYYDSTNVYCRFSNSTSAFITGAKSSGGVSTLTNSRWELYMEVYA